MYYGLIIASTVLFGLQFFFNRIYQRGEGDSLASAMLFSCLNAAVCAVEMFCIGGFKLEFSLFSILVALASAANNLLYSYSAVKSLGRADLSTFSIFAMLGGMALPFVGGIAFWDEELTAVKLICALLIGVALFIGSPRGQSSKGAVKYYVAVFIFNGMSGIISTLHSRGSAHVSSESFIVMSSLAAVLMSSSILFGIKVFGKKNVGLRSPKSSIPSACVYSLISGLGNLFLLIAVSHIDASVQYPIVTGGTIIVSAVISFISGERPSARSMIAVAISFAATLVLVF